MRTRFVKIEGYNAVVQRCWGEKCPKGDGDCHRVRVEVYRSEDEASANAVHAKLWERRSEFAAQLTACSYCGEAAPADERISTMRGSIYNTPTGKPEPGDLFIADWYGCEERESGCVYGWSNCDGRHLICVLPNGRHWDIDARATNCTKPEETTHRCWIRHGDPATGKVHVDKAGNTCAAGAGSIAVPGYHGFLHNGELTGC